MDRHLLFYDQFWIIELYQGEVTMKININKHKNFNDLVVTIDCDERDQSINTLIDKLNSSEQTMIGRKNDRQFVIAIDDVYYIENTEEMSLIYTEKDIFDAKYRLYEVETMSTHFYRVNKSTVLNIKKIKAFKATLNSKLEATLTNNDRIEISRHYVQALKEALGGLK
jgi:DNA-binding LytR/AlgR family response regulator